jgi:hypothetical protein
MWLALIWTKLKSPWAALLPVSLPKARDIGVPALTVQTSPVPGPGHALQKTAAVDAILVEILQLLIDYLLLRHWSSE